MKNKLTADRIVYLAAPAAVTFILLLIYAKNGFYPFGIGTVSWCDMDQQVLPLLLTFKNIVRSGGSLLYSLQMGGGMNFYGEMPRSYNITVNLENPVVAEIVAGLKDNRDKVVEYATGNDKLRQVVDLALLSNGMLKGKALSDFISRSARLLSGE